MSSIGGSLNTGGLGIENHNLLAAHHADTDDVTAPNAGDVPTWDGMKWAPSAPPRVSGSGGTMDADDPTGVVGTATNGADNDAGNGHPGLGFSLAAGDGGAATAGDAGGGAGGDVTLAAGNGGAGHGSGFAGNGGRVRLAGYSVLLGDSDTDHHQARITTDQAIPVSILGYDVAYIYLGADDAINVFGGASADAGLDVSAAGDVALGVTGGKKLGFFTTAGTGAVQAAASDITDFASLKAYLQALGLIGS